MWLILVMEDNMFSHRGCPPGYEATGISDPDMIWIIMVY
jgi:hypothetical protein